MLLFLICIFYDLIYISIISLKIYGPEKEDISAIKAITFLRIISSLFQVNKILFKNNKKFSYLPMILFFSHFLNSKMKKY